ncbi:hypothetical protein SBRY_20565 [Actinacidiphila bryophytorum]|uniref:Uncharacterized protein n=1 Tax=Actinacidiphila bryophytorum TaxID=1436133 RepID=A0A9W4GZH3_9ACTN|nr:hypothetical protein SBRY_20565 [Actinacidiphila bryophytorum]
MARPPNILYVRGTKWFRPLTLTGGRDH